MTADASPNGVPADARGAAAFYIGRGFAPIPLPPRSKRAVIDGWPALRVTPDNLDAYFPDGEDHNIGLLLGKPSHGLIDVDLDEAEAIRAAPFFLPPTGWVTGRKSKPRSHWWYTADDAPDKASEPFKDIDGTMLAELRSSGGQTVAPPGFHESGEKIGWYECTEPATAGVAELRSAVATTAAAALLARHWPAEGGRQDAALALAGGLARANWSADDIQRFIWAAATAAGDDEVEMRCNVAERSSERIKDGKHAWGWPRLAEALGEDGKSVVARVREWLRLSDVKASRDAKKRTVIRPPAPYRPFPTEALPQPIRSFVEQAAGAIGCDPSFVALPALTAAASLIGGKRVIRLKRGWTEPCVLWSCIIGESGTLKSPAIHAGAGFVYRLQQELRHKFKTDLQEYEQQKAVYDDKKRKAKHDGQDFKEEPPELPVLKRIVVSDVTIEILAAILEDNPGGVLLLRDELAAWFNSFSRYKGKQGGSDVPNWLEMHRAGPIVYDRKTGDRRSVFVPRAPVCVTGGIQPGTFARCLTPEYLDAGLGARPLLAWPPRHPKVWKEDEIHPDIAQAYESLLRALADLPEEGEPVALQMTPEAKALWVAWYNEWAKRQAAVEGATAAAYAKLEGGAARLALLHHVVARVSAMAENVDPIEPASMQAGITLARWFAFEAERVYAALAESDDAQQTRRLIDFLRQHGGRLTARRLHQANKARYRSAEDAEAALQTLVDAGLAEWTDIAPGPKETAEKLQGRGFASITSTEEACVDVAT